MENNSKSLDIDLLDKIATAAQGRYDPEIVAEVAIYHGNAARFVAEVGTPDVVLALIARVRELDAERATMKDGAKP